LLLAVPPGLAMPPGVAATRIGQFVAGAGVSVLDAAGEPMVFTRQGWSHFA
jgi:thiamine-monophosphate kinase